MVAVGVVAAAVVAVAIIVAAGVVVRADATYAACICECGSLVTRLIGRLPITVDIRWLRQPRQPRLAECLVAMISSHNNVHVVTSTLSSVDKQCRRLAPVLS